MLGRLDSTSNHSLSTISTIDQLHLGKGNSQKNNNNNKLYLGEFILKKNQASTVINIVKRLLTNNTT